ncbi:MAG: hypothetical protein ACI379_00985 [Nocardioides sp.]|uniref:hypothetical protein n=1 Tax=Nocardioides sp. TaxID=35761 RepID=UPI003EFF4699
MSADVRPSLEQRILVFSGTFMAFVGLAQIAFADGGLELFLGSAAVFSGSMLVFPQLVALAVKRYG